MIVRELLTRMGFSIDQAQVKRAEATIDGIKNSASRLVSFVAGIGAVLGAALSAREILRVADEWNTVQARVALTTDSLQEQQAVMDSLYKISQDTRQQFTATADLFGKVNRNAEELKITSSDVLKLTENINKALVVGGGGQMQNEAAILQLGQALSSGRLQGDELRSLLENAPRLTKAIADGMGVTIGQLRKMGAEGELTADKVVKALLSQTDAVNKEFKKMPMTVSQATTYAGNAFGRFINKVGRDTRIFERIAKGIVRGTDSIISGVERVVKALGGWNNAFKLATILVTSIAAGIIAVKWNTIVNGIKTVAAALMNPAFLKGALIAAALMLIGLAIEDIYTWLQGGDSVIGKWLEGWGITAEQVKGYLTAIKNFFAMVFNFIKSHPALSAGIAAFGTLLLVLGKFKLLGPVFNLLIKIIGSGLIPILMRLGAAMLPLLANPVTWIILGIIAAIAGLIWVIQDLYKWFNGGDSVLGKWLEGWGITTEGIKNAFNAAIEWIKAAFTAFIEFFKPLLDYWINLFKFVFSLLTGDFDGAVNALKQMFLSTWQYISNIFSLFGVDINAVVQNFVKLWDGAVNAVRNFFSGLWTGILEKYNAVIGLINKLPGIELPKVSLQSTASAGRVGSNVSQQFQINNTFGSGTPAYQAAMVSQAVESNYTDTYGPITRALQYGY